MQILSNYCSEEKQKKDASKLLRKRRRELVEADDVNAGHEADDEIEFAKHGENRPSRDIYEIKKEINNYLIIDESDVEDLKPMLNQIFKDKSKTIESLDF